MNSINNKKQLFTLLVTLIVAPSATLFSMEEETKDATPARSIPKPIITPKKVRNPIATATASVPTLPVSPTTDVVRPSSPTTPSFDELASFLKTPVNFKATEQKISSPHTPLTASQLDTSDSFELSPETKKYLDLGEKLTSLKRKDRGVVHKYLGTFEYFLYTVTIPESAQGIIGEINEITQEEKSDFYRNILEAAEREYIEAQFNKQLNVVEEWSNLNSGDKNVLLRYLNYGIRGLGNQPQEQPRTVLGATILALLKTKAPNKTDIFAQANVLYWNQAKRYLDNKPVIDRAQEIAPIQIILTSPVPPSPIMIPTAPAKKQPQAKPTSLLNFRM